MAAEKRRHPRVPKTLTLEFRKDWFLMLKGPRQVAEMVDVSRGGVRLNTRAELKKNDLVTLILPLRMHVKGIRFSGRVAWVRRMFKGSAGFIQAGVQFLPLNREQTMIVFRLATGASER